MKFHFSQRLRQPEHWRRPRESSGSAGGDASTNTINANAPGADDGYDWLQRIGRRRTLRTVTSVSCLPRKIRLDASL